MLQSRRSAADLAAQAAAEGLVEAVSRATVARWLDADAIRPWRHRSWIFPRDPHFEVKAARALDLYQRIWDGTELGDDEYGLSTDEKSPQSSACSQPNPAGTKTSDRRPPEKPEAHACSQFGSDTQTSHHHDESSV